MSGQKILWSIFKRFRRSILITFSLVSLETVAMVLLPFMLGLAGLVVGWLLGGNPLSLAISLVLLLTVRLLGGSLLFNRENCS